MCFITELLRDSSFLCVESVYIWELFGNRSRKQSSEAGYCPSEREATDVFDVFNPNPFTPDYTATTTCNGHISSQRRIGNILLGG